MYHAQAPGARLQQQPPRIANRQQQQSSGSREFQPRQPAAGDGASQMGENGYEGARRYRGGITSGLQTADAKPGSESRRPQEPQA